MENMKNRIGKVLFIISIILCIYMICSNLTHVIFEIDEYFTLAVIKFPIKDIITITSNDVHPPLYYLILKFAVKAFDFLNIQYNLLYVLKILSIIPYILILIISLTKIKKEYGWLTAGLFTFTLITLSEFYINYLSIRMYSWSIFFLIMSFIYLKGIFTESNKKSWILFTLFTILGAYTHYFVALSSFLIYLALFIYIIANKDKTNFKNWILSAIIAIISYIPWIPSLITQLHSVHENYWIPQIDLNYFLNCISSIAINNSDFTINSQTNLILLVITLLTLAILIIIAINEYKNNKNSENYYVLTGIILFILTLVIGILISITFKPIIRVRYLIPAIAVFWLSVSIMIGKLENKKLLTILLSLILILSIFCYAETIENSFELDQNGIIEQKILDDIKNDNSSLIITKDSGFFQFGTYINDTKLYTDVDGFYGIENKKIDKLFDYTLISKNKFKKVIRDNPDKTIYLIEPSWNKINIGSNVNLTKIHHVPNSGFTIYSINNP